MLQNELIAILSNSGTKIGVKPRRNAHLDGDWHAIAFVWACRITEDRKYRIMFQIRSSIDDPFSGQADALAAGHVLNNESPLDAAIRECLEEVGLHLDRNELTYLGCRKVEDLSISCNRTFQHHYLFRGSLSLSQSNITNEVNGFVEVDLDDFMQLLQGTVTRISAQSPIEKIDGFRSSTISYDALAKYSPQIIDTFKQLAHAIQSALGNGVINEDLLK
jgi:8-oxo-dGTP pyrophosphatase MutT (NUDIX family)